MFSILFRVKIRLDQDVNILSHDLCNRFYFTLIFGVAEQIGRKSMPLRYNYDKPEKPRISRVFGYQARFFILFQPEKSSREVVIS